jgi:hypothetical protein
MFTVFWIFEVPVYKGFRALGSEISRAVDFGAILVEALVLLCFCNLGALLGRPFSTHFWPRIGRLLDCIIGLTNPDRSLAANVFGQLDNGRV